MTRISNDVYVKNTYFFYRKWCTWCTIEIWAKDSSLQPLPSSLSRAISSSLSLLYAIENWWKMHIMSSYLAWLLLIWWQVRNIKGSVGSVYRRSLYCSCARKLVVVGYCMLLPIVVVVVPHLQCQNRHISEK